MAERTTPSLTFLAGPRRLGERASATQKKARRKSHPLGPLCAPQALSPPPPHPPTRTTTPPTHQGRGSGAAGLLVRGARAGRRPRNFKVSRVAALSRLPCLPFWSWTTPPPLGAVPPHHHHSQHVVAHDPLPVLRARRRGAWLALWDGRPQNVPLFFGALPRPHALGHARASTHPPMPSPPPGATASSRRRRRTRLPCSLATRPLFGLLTFHPSLISPTHPPNHPQETNSLPLPPPRINHA